MGEAREDLFHVNNSMEGSTEKSFLKMLPKEAVASDSCSAGTPD